MASFEDEGTPFFHPDFPIRRIGISCFRGLQAAQIHRETTSVLQLHKFTTSIIGSPKRFSHPQFHLVW